ncbi:MAG: methylenetetrahydrofolate--tRNA-(uracil(54)-C(5))-methyltransferase (FADH(2)-oxidizing) TrmFO [Desulfobacca sp. 4484_104]|nr:MAG: methylenetetrahydrofolate--tRNA-(uracil(54)-C(5))-methyltransferase (FADH(2)-oxidizing) TrmFO [Desulfobacca sp. 4484_104]RLA90177.1 MAG: methylenetetrahydrofolate--tRNA-(uracil(54)-C(5))-methyltransferase (FADH(2)-oxidizing) TrmFO [Deltaproteobacteria bacterium]
MTRTPELVIIGGGLAGSEAAWQAAQRGVRVRLYDMKPHKFSPAHQSPQLGELVCSNSLRSAAPDTAVGLLKLEMRRLHSLIMQAADASRVPAGKSLAVDREAFAAYITHSLEQLTNMEIIRAEITQLDLAEPVIVATGPLTSEPLAQELARLTGQEHLHFYDAISPIVFADSIDYTKVFRASRYGVGEDYLNCPMSQTEYDRFYQALMTAEQVPLRSFEEPRFFEGCLPIEVLAARGYQTLVYGPMKPVGLRDPATGRQPFAVVQLRQDNRQATLYNLVGFQTKLKYPEQKRVLRLIPGLEQAEFARLGSVHRNTFVQAPGFITTYLNCRGYPQLFLAGQISGVEGYVESTAMGLIAGINATRQVTGQSLLSPPRPTALGALIHHLTDTTVKDFQPTNVNFGLFPPLLNRLPKKARGAAYARRAQQALEAWLQEHPELGIPYVEPNNMVKDLRPGAG